jgi:hypothetical protein
MLPLLLYAHERRDVATAAIVGAYHHDRFCSTQDYRVSSGGLCGISPIPIYKLLDVFDRSKQVIYLKLIKALYGCIKSAFLWYQLFTETLLQQAFSLNPRDSCIANCTIEGTQCTIIWYGNDLKISHVILSIVTSIVDLIEAVGWENDGHQSFFLVRTSPSMMMELSVS